MRDVLALAGGGDCKEDWEEGTATAIQTLLEDC